MKTITKTIAYAYVHSEAIIANTDYEGQYRMRISFTYELLDQDRAFVEWAHVEHFSEPSETKFTTEQLQDWLNENRVAFIAADKLNLAGYGE